MENPAADVIIGVEVSSICCAEYQKKLRKELSKVIGLCSIDIDQEKGLITIRGKVDPDSILDIIKETGKKPEIVYYNKKPSNNHKDHHSHAQGFRHHNENVHGRHSPKHASRHRICSSCQDDKRGHKQEEHKCEDYVPPYIDERVCGDFYCKTHRMRPIFSDRVPSGISAGLFGVHHGYVPGWLREDRYRPPYGFDSGFEHGFYGDENDRGCVVM